MARCNECRTSGTNMKQCSNCGNLICSRCGRVGKGHYPKMKSSNICPYCGKTGVLKTAK